MNKTVKKVLSLVLMMIMILSSVPMASFALGWCDISGHKIEWVEVKAATCTTSGEQVQKCTRDGCTYVTDQKRETVALAHPTAYRAVIQAADPTCDKVGNTAGEYCTLCGAITIECNYKEALGHTPVTVPEKPATCTEKGRTAGTECSVCKAPITGCVDIPAFDHNYKLVSFTAGTCTTPSEEVKVCKTCGDKKIDKKDAEHDFSVWTTSTVATCTTAGKMVRTCRECNLKEYKDVEKAPHTEVVVHAKEATCTVAGMTSGKKCNVCGKVTEGCTEIPAPGHKEKIVAGTPAACGEKGLSDSAYCEVCKEVTRAQVEIAALDHIMTVTTLINPDCNNEGKKVEKCTRVGCNYEKTTVLPKTHEVNWTVNQRATCTADGSQSGYCTACRKTVIEVIPATGHTVTNALSWRTTVHATCTKEGEKVATCATCGGNAKEVIPALGHVEVIATNAKAPTCSEEGATESKQCSVCKTITVKAEKIDKLAHTFGEWTETKTATCKAAGVKEAVCSVCNEKKLETIDRLPHTEEITPAVEATCTTAGSTKGVTCSVCKDVLEKVTPIDALGHKYVKDEAQCKEPDCVNEGKFYGTCSVCGDLKDEILPAKGHDNEVYPGTPADCTLTGLSDGMKCKVCGQITAEPEQTPPLGHDFVVDANTSTPATCTKNGYEYLKCSRCEATDQREAPATGHSYGEWEVTLQPTCDKQGEKTRVCVTCGEKEIEYIESNGSHDVQIQAAVEATCTTEGKTQGSYCAKCNEIFEVQEIIPAAGHKVDGVEPTLTKATFKKEGSYAVRCTTCDELVDPQVISKIDEKSIKLSTAKCTYNGKKRTPSVTVKDVDGKVLEKDTDYSVKYDSGRTKVGEYKITVTFKGKYEGKKTLIFTIAPAKTTKITATSSQKEYVKLSWAAVEGATGYRVYVYETVEGKTRKKVASVNGKTTYNLQKDYLGDTMAVGAQYKVAVVAYTKLEDGTVIHATAGTAKTFTRTPGKPSLTVTTKSGKAELKWTNVEDETGYQVYYATSKDGEYKKLTSTAKNAFSKAFTKGKTLYFKVRAYTKFDGEVIYGKYSDVKSVTIK